MKKVLYVDRAFIGLKGGDKNRSNFLYSTLKSAYSVELAIVKVDKSEVLNESANIELLTTKPPFYQSKAIYSFSKYDIDRFVAFVKDNSFDLVFFRFCSMANLAKVIDNMGIKVVVDVDMLFSRISRQAWFNNISIKNRYYFIEYTKQLFFEKLFFNKNFLYLFTNQVELNLVEKSRTNSSSKYEVLPNVMQRVEVDLDKKLFDKRYVIFYGMLNSTANIDAYKFLVNSIYSKIEPILKENNLKIYIVGRGKSDIYRDFEYLKVIGDVDDISLAIANSEFVFLPLRVGSGTRTRVLEAAFVKKAVLTTPIGLEGLNFNQDEVVVKSSEDELVLEFKRLAESKEYRDRLGSSIYTKALEEYLDENVAKKLVEFINKELDI
jgi:glycosyltransferase involved in cell wall biosynthesis